MYIYIYIMNDENGHPKMRSKKTYKERILEGEVYSSFVFLILGDHLFLNEHFLGASKGFLTTGDY